jgi:hypothetical protein
VQIIAHKMKKKSLEDLDSKVNIEKSKINLMEGK